MHSARESLDLGAQESGFSWSAVFAGTAGAAALSLILLLLGAAFGFAAVSPWVGAGATALGIGSILWLALTHVAVSGLGGYLAGRLRPRWRTLRDDEVYFRDTVHGFLTWSIATLLTAALVTTGVGAWLDQDGEEARNSDENGSIQAAFDGLEEWRLEYYVDMLFRADEDDLQADSQTRERAARVLRYGMTEEELQPADSQYLAQMVVQNTGLSPQQAQQRVDEVRARVVRSHEDAVLGLEEVQAAAAWASGWMFIALLLGAFFASFAATIGGRHRDTEAEIREP